MPEGYMGIDMVLERLEQIEKKIDVIKEQVDDLYRRRMVGSRHGSE